MWRVGAVLALPALVSAAAQVAPGAGTAVQDAGAISADELEGYRQAADGSEDPEDWYNLGAALLVGGDNEGAAPHLTRARNEAEGDPKTSAQYNLGLVDGRAGAPNGLARNEPATNRRSRLLEARQAFREVLRMDRSAEDARWNLELVDRWLVQNQPPESPGGGGGGGGGSSGGGGGGAGDAPLEVPQMSAAEAAALLEAAAAQERGLQERRLDRARGRDPVVEQNW
ncbi:MAG: hypothetical protein ABFS14_07690 [Gemmatimonadota bacterium]